MSSTNAESFARLLRLRAEVEPLRIDVAGSSMGRTIVSGSAVWVVGPRPPRWGEIWAFCTPEPAVEVHRFVGRRNGTYRFWGDGNPTADEPSMTEMLIGRRGRRRTPRIRVRARRRARAVRQGVHLRRASLAAPALVSGPARAPIRATGRIDEQFLGLDRPRLFGPDRGEVCVAVAGVELGSELQARRSVVLDRGVDPYGVAGLCEMENPARDPRRRRAEGFDGCSGDRRALGEQ